MQVGPTKAFDGQNLEISQTKALAKKGVFYMDFALLKTLLE